MTPEKGRLARRSRQARQCVGVNQRVWRWENGMTAWFYSGCCPLRHACAADLRRWALVPLKRPGSERHQAQHLLLQVRINPTGGGINHGGQIHAGARVHDGVNQTRKAVRAVFALMESVWVSKAGPI